MHQGDKPKDPPSRLLWGAQGLVSALGALSTAAVVITMLLIIYGVFMRYLLNRPPIFVDEITAYLLVLIVFFGVARTFEAGGHIRVELVVNRLPHKVRQWLRAVTLLLGVVYGLILAWQAWNLVESSRQFSLKSFFVQMPAYIPQSLILVGTLALTFVLIRALVRHIQQLGQGSEEQMRDRPDSRGGGHWS